MLVRLVMRAQLDLAPPGSLRRYRPKDDILDVGCPGAQDKNPVRFRQSKRNHLTATAALGSVNTWTC